MTRPMQDYYPPLKERGMVELVAAKRASMELWYLIAAPAATSYALTFVDAEGNPVTLADADYVATCQAEGTVCYVDESTKTTTGCTFLSVDFAGSATNFLNSLNIRISGRDAKQPATQL